MNKVRIALEFAGVVLPVAKDEQGRDVVPLKPIVDVFGLKWEKQREKVCTPQSGGAATGLGKRVGTCLVQIFDGTQKREMVCIRLDRVAAYLNSISPAQARAGGNVSGAAFLEQKQEEWDDLIHEYEMAGGIFASREQREASQRMAKVRAIVSLGRVKNSTESTADRKLYGELMQGLAGELGMAYQPDLLEAK